MASFTRSRTAYAALPNLPSLYSYPLRNWKEAAASSKVHGLPAVGVRLTELAERLQVMLCKSLCWGFIQLAHLFRSATS